MPAFTPSIIITALSAVSAIFYILLIPAILIQNFKSKPHRFFAAYLAFTSLIIFCLFITYLYSDKRLAEIAFIVISTLSIYAAASYFLFVIALIKAKLSRVEEILIMLFLTTISVSMLVILGNYITTGTFPAIIGQIAKSKITDFYIQKPTSISFILTPFTFAFFALSWRQLLKTIFESRSVFETERLKYLFIGVSIILFSYVKAYIPFGVVRDLPTEVPSALINVILITYAITRYQLLNVNLILAKIIFYFNLTILITGLYLGVGILLQNNFLFEGLSLATVIAAAAIITLIYQPLSQIVQKLVNKIVVSQGYDPAEYVDELARQLSALSDIESLEKKVTSMLGKAIDVSELKILSGIPGRLENSHPTVIHDISDGKLVDFMQKNNFELIAPLLGGSKMLGFLVLGQKNHNRSYTLTDIHLISATASQLAISLENARNYDEVLKSLKFKDEFITIASAHLRTPVTAILGYLRYLTDNKNKLAVSQQQTIIGHVRANSERLASLIDELLTISALEHGKVKTIPRDTQIEEVIDEVVDSLSYFAGEHRVTISYIRPKQSFPKIYLDPIKVREAISNIISNGIRFNNPGGQVTIELSKKGKFVEIVITDNGIGIKKEDTPYLFQKFHRISSQSGGVGLGLYIAKLIIKAHNGNLNLQSEVNKGTVVTITLPVKGLVASQIIFEEYNSSH